MSEAFLKVVNMSISAGWLVLAVLALRPILKKAPKWVNVLLWGIVAFRLICPVSIESALSLIPSAETISPDIMMDWTPEVSTGIKPLDQVVNPVISTSFAPQLGASANPLQILIPVATNFWLLGVLIMLVYTAISYLSLCRKLRTAVILRDNIFQCETVCSPFVLGILKPRIYLPYDMEGQRIDHVIAHEQAHIRRKDHWWKPLGFLLLTVYWFNPLMWVAYILLCRDIELACDEKVIAQLGNEQRADYTEALVACSVNRRMIAACPLAFGEVGVKDRVKSIMNYRKPTFWIIVLAVLLCIMLAVSMLTDPIQKTTPAEILSKLDIEDVQWAQATIWDVPAGNHVMLDAEQVDELVTILKSLEASDFVENAGTSGSISVMVNCGKHEILMHASNEFVHFSFDSETAEMFRNTPWSIKNNDLNVFFTNIQESKIGTDVDHYIVSITDRTVTEHLPTDEAIEPFWEDENYIYSFSSIRSHLVMVTYNDGSSEDIKTALAAGRATIEDLNNFGIHYYVEAKASVMQPTQTNLRGLVAGYLFTPFNGATYRYALTDPNPANVTADHLLDTFSEDYQIDGVVWEVYTLKEYPDKSKLLLRSGVGGAWLCEYAPAQQAEEGALEAAREAGYVITENGTLTDGKEAWEEFYEKILRGEPASIHVAHYFTLDPDRTVPSTYEALRQDYPALYIDELSYDGERFVLRTESNVRVYEYLMKYHVSGTPTVGHPAGREEIHYALTHDNTHTWEQLWGSLLSSAAGVAIDHYTVCSEYQ